MNTFVSNQAFADLNERRWYQSVQAASQIELELLYSKSQLQSAMREDFLQQFQADLKLVAKAANSIELDEELTDDLSFSVEFLADLMAQAAIRRRAPFNVFVGVLVSHFLDDTDPYQTCANAIVAAASYDIVELVSRQMPGSNQTVLEIVVRFEATQATRDRVEQFQYPLPMIEPPLPVTNNKQTGYRTIRGSLLLKDNHHDDDICLDHINRMNAIPLAINADVVAFIQNSWKNLDKPKPDETYAEYRDRRKAFAKYDRTSRDVIAAMMMQQSVYLCHKYDKRGRTYCLGYHFHYQGNDWNKAIVQLAEPEYLNEE